MAKNMTLTCTNVAPFEILRFPLINPPCEAPSEANDAVTEVGFENVTAGAGGFPMEKALEHDMQMVG